MSSSSSLSSESSIQTERLDLSAVDTGVDGVPPPELTPEGADVGGGFSDPDSPNSKADSTSSSSEGVLVEHPVNADQEESEIVQGGDGDPDSGILVNIDGSMQENVEGDDGSREDSFVVAPDDLGFAERRTTAGLEESIAMIEIGENTREEQLMAEVNRLQALLSEAVDECIRYKGEQEFFSREIGNMQYQLNTMIHRKPPISGGENDVMTGNIQKTELAGIHEVNAISLHSVLRDCSGLMSLLRVSFDEQIQSEGENRGLNLALSSKDQEIESLNVKLSEYSVSGEVVDSYMTSIRNEQLEFLQESYDSFVKRQLASLASVISDNEILQDSPTDEVSLAEKKTSLLIEKYSGLYYYIEKLRDYLSGVGYEFSVAQGEAVGLVLDATRNELLDSKTRESFYMDKINEHEQEKAKMFEQLESMTWSLEEATSQVRNAKKELEMMEQKYLAVKEKLAIAVTKGKTLVQNRDSLKQLLAEKSLDLEMCLHEVKDKADELDAVEQRMNLQSQSHQKMVLQKDNTLQALEEALSHFNVPVEMQSIDIVDRIRWLIDQWKMSEEAIMENNKLQHVLVSFGLPTAILSTSLESQINWLFESSVHAKEDATKIQDKLVIAKVAFESCEEKLLEARKEIEQLGELVYVEKQEKYALQMMNEDLMSKHESMLAQLSRLSSKNNRLMRALEEASDILMSEEGTDDVDNFIERCIGKIRERVSASSESSSVMTEAIQRIKSLLYVRNMELALSEKMLEDEKIESRKLKGLAEELCRVSKEAVALRSERNTVQKDLQHAEEKSSLIREKLSMAVKKGKGLFAEREGLKQLLDEKNSAIEKLKHELDSQQSTIIECNEQIKNMTADLKHLEKLKSDVISITSKRDHFKQLLLESNGTLQQMTEYLEQIVFPSDITLEGPVERMKYFVKLVYETNVSRKYAENELEKVKEEAIFQTNKLNDAFTTIRSLENELSRGEKHVKVILEEMEKIQHSKSSTELELQKVKDEAIFQAAELEKASANIRSLEDALSKAEKQTVITHEEKEKMQLVKSSVKLELQKVKEEANVLTGEWAKACNNVNLLEETLLKERERISLLVDEKDELEFKSKQEIMTLNSRIAACMEELAGKSGNLENQSTAMVSQFRHLLSLAKDESLLSVINKRFSKNVEGLDGMVNLVESIRDQFSAEVQTGSEQGSAVLKLLSLPKFEDYFRDNAHKHYEGIAKPADEIPSFTSVAEGIATRTNIVNDYIAIFSGYMQNHVNHLVQALREIKNDVIHQFEIGKFYKKNIIELQASNEGYSVEISTLQDDRRALHSVYSDVIRILQINFQDILDGDQSEEMSNLGLEFHGVSMAGTGSEEHIEAAESLLVVAKRIKNQIYKFAEARKKWRGTIDDLRSKLEKAEVTAESAILNKDLQHGRVTILEGELLSLQKLYNESNSRIEDYQSREVMWKEKEKELVLLQEELSLKAEEDGKKQELESQLEILFDKVNKVMIPFKELEMEKGQELNLLGSIDKVVCILSSLDTLQHAMNTMNNERENLQLSLSSHVDEVNKLRKIAKSVDYTNQLLENRKNDLDEVATRLARMIQKFGVSGSRDDQDSIDAKGSLLVLERLMINFGQESESSKSRVQELGAKLLASQKVVDELLAKVKLFENSIIARSPLAETKERSIFESSSSIPASEISEDEDSGTLGKNSLSPAPGASHMRQMRKGLTDHLVLNIDSASDALISSIETDEKGHVFKSLNSSVLIPTHGKMVADRVDSMWVSGSRILMARPGARIGVIAYCFLLHIWVLGTIL